MTATKASSILGQDIPMGIYYYISKRGQEQVGSKKLKKIFLDNTFLEQSLWQIVHGLKAILLLTSTEFSHASMMRLKLEQEDIRRLAQKKKSVKYSRH